MAGITSSTGLISGIPIQDTVDKLIAVAGRPRDLIATRSAALKKQQTAVDSLSSRVLAFQFAVNKLKATTVFHSREATSSNKDVLTASISTTGTATPGTYKFKAVQSASAQQAASQRFDSPDDAPASGKLSLGFGGLLDRGIALAELNSGAGVVRGKIKLTDRSGVSAVIDLSTARTVDDVLTAINSNTDVSITASVVGDRFVLTDGSGGSGTLSVAEFGGGGTGAALGLVGGAVSGGTLTGGDVFRLHTGTKLSTLNDGNGVRITKHGVVDLDVTLRDGSTLAVDLADATTLGDVITQINAASPSKLSAAISADGNRIQLSDLTAGAGSFTVENGVASTAADDLGLAKSVDGATLQGGRLVAGLRDTLLSSLKGGQGLGVLGSIAVTDRAGHSATINLATAETLGDVISTINASSAVDVTAAVNASRTGLVVTDDSGGAGTLVIANVGGTLTAKALGIEVNAAVTAKDSGSLARQSIGTATLLASLNGGKGISLGDVKVTNSAGVTQTADLNTLGSEAKTVGDVIDAINGLHNLVEARINDTGDGILLIDTAGGDKTLGVKSVTGNVAEALHLTRASEKRTLEGTERQVVDGARSATIDLAEIQAAGGSLLLSTLHDGKGIDDGDVLITDSSGERSVALDLNGADSGLQTLGQLVDAINAKANANGTGVVARINAKKTGIELEDTAGGTNKLTVKDLGGGSSAVDLNIAGEAKLVDGKQIIDGSGLFDLNDGRNSRLASLAARINRADVGVTAQVQFDGTGYRLTVAADATGEANQFTLDAAAAGFAFEQTSQAQDGLLLSGNAGSNGGSLLLSSANDTFKNAAPGVDVVVNEATGATVTVTVAQKSSDVTDAVKGIVDSYNSLRSDLSKLTAFDAANSTTGLLFGTSEALQVDSRLSRALTDRFLGVGRFQSLAELGVSVEKDGTLSLDKTKLGTAFEADSQAVEKFFADASAGFVKKLGDVVDRTAGAKTSLLASRSASITATLEVNQKRITAYGEQLDKQKEQMLLRFNQLELIISKLRQSQTAIGSIKTLTSTSTSTSTA